MSAALAAFKRADEAAESWAGFGLLSRRAPSRLGRRSYVAQPAALSPVTLAQRTVVVDRRLGFPWALAETVGFCGSISNSLGNTVNMLLSVAQALFGGTSRVVGSQGTCGWPVRDWAVGFIPPLVRNTVWDAVLSIRRKAQAAGIS